MQTVSRKGTPLTWKIQKRRVQRRRRMFQHLDTIRRAIGMKYESAKAQKRKRSMMGKLRFLRNAGLPTPINPTFIPPEFHGEVIKMKHDCLTRNSVCPCGSGKRFKRCHMISVKDKINQAVGGVA